ncbi:hypothetical protein STRAU_2531 [Streptomyces aurantiacus JA 4570]|uniref:Uncharacterized protein n=1 Tax=Streptomyces aurantiacus JA 4570 TaxID=1286094 RepID=S3ZNL9_9ACTN|nr:hypothetical protein STRAU_2531 [Streptomyces aurantiacus JA 4570]
MQHAFHDWPPSGFRQCSRTAYHLPYDVRVCVSIEM